jgi:hypothetical protein
MLPEDLLKMHIHQTLSRPGMLSFRILSQLLAPSGIVSLDMEALHNAEQRQHLTD